MNDLLFSLQLKITKPETEQHINLFCSERYFEKQQVIKADIYYYHYIHSV